MNVRELSFYSKGELDTSNKSNQTLIEDSVKISYRKMGTRGSVYMESFSGNLKPPDRLLFVRGRI